MKKLLKYFIFAFAIVALVSCNSCETNGTNSNGQGSSSSGGTTQNPSGTEQPGGSTSGGSSSETPENPDAGNTDTPGSGSQDTPTENQEKVLVAYFSVTNNTNRVAETIASTIEADIHRIEASEPYTQADITWTNSDSRASIENSDDTARPEIANSIDNLDDYYVIFLGYPIWWGKAPKILYTFVENTNLSGKTIVPFCTSASSPAGSSATILERLKANNGTWMSSRRFSGTASASEISSWINSLNLGITAK